MSNSRTVIAAGVLESVTGRDVLYEDAAAIVNKLEVSGKGVNIGGLALVIQERLYPEGRERQKMVLLAQIVCDALHYNDLLFTKDEQ